MLLDNRFLPSKGLFYKDDFTISIKKASKEDIDSYIKDFDEKNIGLILDKIKKIVNDNVIVSEGYNPNYIKGVDIVWVFFEIVKITKSSPIYISTEKDSKIEVSFENFKYIDFDLTNFDNIDKQFYEMGWKYSPPAIGVENSLNNFLIINSITGNISKYKDISFNFIFFLSDKDSLSYDEIENLIQIFNYDIDKYQYNQVIEVIENYKEVQSYILINDGEEIDIIANINFMNIWDI